MVFTRKVRRFKRCVKNFLLINEKRVVLVLFGMFVFIGPMFGGSVIGEVIDKILIGGTVLANGRILEIF